ncbi:hypothetical protein [Helicobacter pylori]|uniref:hypothetical protein n=1 Tax=Helicobacter pylori TaxID=210 RepID=UPI001FF4CE7A|nr:hypothetical protein [Helicobacter pylori]MCK0501631.1 hypothetical protein [Helicobacter pylori]
MNEKTESEIFEEQLNSLYKPIKQEKKTPSTPESEDKTRLASINKATAQGGQVTQKLRDEAKEMTRWGFRSKEENTARATQTQEILLNSLRKNLQMLESLGGNLSPLMLAKIKEHQAKTDYINDTGEKIDLKKYQRLAGDN